MAQSLTEPAGRTRTTVVDITYLCDATCRYCRWGSAKTPGRKHRDLEDMLIPAETLELLGTQRVVISGGEPTLHPEIGRILAHYSRLVERVVVITNGYGLDSARVAGLRDAGASGFTISLDSTDPDESFLVRRTPSRTHRGILSLIESVAGPGRDFELGINATVTHVTANRRTVNGLLGFGRRMGLDFVKFQPVFDDGYTSLNAPDLLLGRRDVPGLEEIAKRADLQNGPPTNPPGFWKDVAKVAAGARLPAGACAIGPADALSVGGRLSMCYWVGGSEYGGSSEILTRQRADAVQDGFEGQKRRCAVGFHCFCNQGIDHVWEG